MLHHEHRVTFVYKTLQHFEQHIDIGEVQAGGGLIEQIKRAASALLDQFAGKFNSLCLATGKGWGSLAQLEIIEADIGQRLQLVPNTGHILKQFEGLLHIHIENIGDRFLFEPHLQRFAAETLSFASGAHYPNIGEEIHIEFRRAVSFARFAASFRHVKAKTPWLVTAPLRFWQLGEEIADVVEHFDIGAGIGSRGAANRRLIDGDQLIEMFNSLHFLVLARRSFTAVQIAAQRFDENIIHQ